MNVFKQDLDVKAGVEIAYKVMKGMGQPDFDQGTGIAHRFGISNINFSETNLGSSFRSAKLNFSLEDSDIEAELLFDNFSIKKKAKAKNPSYEQEFSKEDLVYKLTGNSTEDKDKIEKMIIEMSLEDHSIFKKSEEDSYFSKVISLEYGDAYCFDRNLARLFFELVGKQLQFISMTETRFIKQLLLLNDDPIRFEIVEKTIAMEFEQSFKVLKEHGHSVEGEFDYNDMDNKMYFVEKDKYQGVVYETQNQMFLVAKDKETNVIKVWNCMEVKEDWYESLVSNLEYEDNIFNVAEYMIPFVDSRYSHKFDYPFTLNNDFYRKDVDSILQSFDTLKSNLIYNSESGFTPEKYSFFNSLADTISYSNDVITEEYQVEQERLILTTMDHNSPDYFVRTMTSSIAGSRAAAFHYLFLVIGTGFYWNGKTFTDNQSVIKDFPENKKETDYSKITDTDPLSFGSSGLLFNLPENMTPEWEKAVFEMAFYLKEWHELNNDMETYKNKIEHIYNKYFKEEWLSEIENKRL